jgi:hypothetical protein
LGSGGNALIVAPSHNKHICVVTDAHARIGDDLVVRKLPTISGMAIFDPG